MRHSEFSSALWARICQDPDAVAWVTPTGSKSYADLAKAICSRTASLAARGLVASDRVVLVLRDDWSTFTTWLAVLFNGATPIVLSSDVSVERLQAIVRAARARHVILEGNRPLTAPAPQPAFLDIADLQGDHAQMPSLERPQDGTAFILFTSGTTSASKGVVISHENLAAQLATIARVFRVGPGARVYNGLVLYHVDGLIQGPLLCAATGATLLRPPPFRAAQVETDLGWLAREAATHMVGAPTLFEMILRAARRDDYFRRPDFVALLSSSAKLSPKTWDALEARFGVPVINEYGMTETVAASHFAGPFPEMGARYTIGRPIDCLARIVDAKGNDLPQGQPGELLLKGPNIFGGYLDDPVRTAESFLGEWFRTGDLAVETPEGDHQIVGRIKSAINFGGFLIQPEEIDEAILRHQGVEDAVTVGVEDDIFGQVPFSAFVAGERIAPEEILATCRSYLEARKVPRQVIQLDGIPRTGSGKPDLAAVRTLLLGRVPKRGVSDNSLSQQVIEVAAKVFGVPASNLTPQSTAQTTAGWDSFAQTSLALEVEAAFKVTIPTADILTFESLGELTRIVAGLVVVKEPVATPQLQTLSHGRGLGTLVVMPDLGGRSEYVRHLVGALEADLSVAAFSVDPQKPPKVAQTTVRDIAEDLADDIQAAGLSRPVVLMGHSFAGYLAYETAAVLEARGVPTDGVILLDTAVPWKYRQDAALRGFGFRLRTLGNQIRGHRKADDTVLHELGFWKIDLDRYPAALQGILRRWYGAMTSYQPSRSGTPVLVFTAKNRWDNAIFLKRDLGWCRFTSSSVTGISMGRDHLALVQDLQTAAQIGSEINRHFRGLGK